MTTANKGSLLQMEERMERERKVWNEHKELLIAGERAKFEEEKTRLLKEVHEQLKLEQDRVQRLEQKLYETQMVISNRRKKTRSFQGICFLIYFSNWVKLN